VSDFIELSFNNYHEPSVTFRLAESCRVIIEVSGPDACGICSIEGDELAMLRGFLEAAEQYRKPQ
jgi:hypothetical protein